MSLVTDLQRAFTLIRQLQGALAGLRFAAGIVSGGGGSTYTLVTGINVASVTGTGTGVCRVVLDGAALASSLYPIAVINDNAGRFCTVDSLVDNDPPTFDVYQWTDAAAAVNRSFVFLAAYKPS